MITTTSRLRARLLPIAFLALLAAACGGEAAARQASPTRSATPSPTSAAPSPSNLAAQPLTASEARWIRAVEQLQPAMNKVFTDSPEDLSPAALATLAYQLSGCRRELARIGPATARLQPVQALVERACTEYDKGAACFAAARAGVSSSTASFGEVEKQITCGFAVSESGGEPLAVAQIVAADIAADIKDTTSQR